MVKDGGVAARVLCALCPGFRAFQRAQLGKGATCRRQGFADTRAVAAEMQSAAEDEVGRVSLMAVVVVSLEARQGRWWSTQQEAGATLLAARRHRTS
jgi:hypothetical protein